MRAPDVTLRRAVWGLPAAYLTFGATGLALAWSNGVLPVAFDELVLVPIFALYVLVGALVVNAQPRNAIGWLLALAGLSATAGFALEQFLVSAARRTDTGLAVGIAGWVSLWLWMLMLGALVFIVLLFPNGRLPSSRWRPAALATAAVLVLVSLIFAFGTPGTEAQDVAVNVPNPFYVPALRPLYDFVEGAFVIYFALVALAFAALVTRFRRSRGTERQQLKWLVAAGLANVVAIGLGLVSPIFDGAWLVAITAIPLAIGIAILRHGLYEIDVLINRALVYGTVSALLLGTYVLGVLALSAVLRPVTGGGDIAVAGSTLAVVALFQPLRARVQRIVDRRFYRSRYDARRTVDAFSARMRDQVDLDALEGELIGVVTDAVQPAHASLWLRHGR